EVWDAQSEHVAHDLLRQRHVEGGWRREADHRQSRIHLHQKMREPFGWRATAGVDGVFGADDRLVDRQPAQEQPKLRPLVAEVYVVGDGANLDLQVRQREYRVTRFLEEAAG